MVQPRSHPLAENAPDCGADFEASDDEAGCQSDEDNLCDVLEPTDTEVSCQQVIGARWTFYPHIKSGQAPE